MQTEDLRSSWESMLNLEVLLMFDMIQNHPYFVPGNARAPIKKNDLTSPYSQNNRIVR